MALSKLIGVMVPVIFAVFARAAETASFSPSEFDRSPVRFTYELTLGHLDWKTSGPFTGITKSFRQNPIPYRIELTAVSLARPMPLRATFWSNFELVHSVVWSSITRGPENHWGGVVTGLRYHHDLPTRFRSSLFASWQGGIGAIDSSGLRYAQETDLTFTYLNALGVHAQVTEDLGLDIQLLGQHISNGWQTHPSEGIDCSGVSLAFRYRPKSRR
jgi:hypothetical protein